jgi:glucose-6-phosphate isomerase
MRFILHEEKISVSEKDNKLALDYIKRLQGVLSSSTYDVDESSLILPSDEETIESVWRIKNELNTKELKYIFLVGIGGSNLGTKAVYDALRGHFKDIKTKDEVTLIFFDTTDPNYLNRITAFIEKKVSSPREFVLNIISKSGGTMETLMNAEVLIKELENRFNAIENRIVITTDDGSKLWNISKEKGLHLLPIPKRVGGRFSVFSSVGLFPLALCGFDIEGFRAGAIAARKDCIDEDPKKNTALQSALWMLANYKRGRVINDNFFFNPELESLGKWYRQLLAESIGKEKNRSGESVHVGITPTVSIGSTDLHSVGQLYFGGPKDKFTTLIFAPNKEGGLKVPTPPFFGELSSLIKDRSASDIITAIYEGTKTSYIKAGMSVAEVVLERVDEREIGAYMQFKMIEIMILAELFDINAFDQPNVELYKNETRQHLSN